MGILQKAGDFLGISKFGQGIASTIRVATGEVGKDIALQQQASDQSGKLLYAAKQEKDPTRRAKLLKMATDITSSVPTASQIDPGLNLSNREILGSAANIALNVATPGAFKGGKAAIIGKNALLGGAFGAAAGLEKNRSAKGVVGSTVGGALIGGALGTASVGLKALKDFTSKTTPKWLMDKAIKPTLDEARKTVKYGQQSFGSELLKEGVKGSPKKLLQIADSKLTSLEDDLQKVLSSPSLSGVRITRESIAPHLQDLMTAKAGTPGLQGEVQRIKNIFDSIPEQLTIQEANQMKRRIYSELRDVSYKLDAKLATKGKTLKLIAGGLKTEIENAVGGTVVRDINQKLSLYGRLETRIVDQMARSMQNNSFGLTDAILTAGGMATMNPVLMLSALGKHAVGSTAFRTTAAQGLSKIQKVGTGFAGQAVKNVTKKAILNIP